MTVTLGDVLWTPPADVRESTVIGRYADWLARERGVALDDYDALFRWSVDALEDFWASVWDFFGVRAQAPYERVLSERVMPGARWFEGARLNYAQHMVGADDDLGAVAVLGRSQTRAPVELTFGDLREQVARARAGLERLGVGPGDRVVAYLPNIPETLVAFLATASLGAIWATCAPEFGARAVIDRFGIVEPQVLLAIAGYGYGAKHVDRRAEVAAIRAELPTLEHVVHVLCILFSSGTTGLPKPIVHGHGGILLEAYKNHGLSWDLKPGDRLLWFSTTAWMMWNALVSSLVHRASIVMIDGNPGYPDLAMQWRLAEETRPTFMGASPALLMGCRKAGVDLTKLDLSSIRQLGAAGSPLPTEGYAWVYEQLGPDVLLNCGSGGTDVCTGIVQGGPMMPVYAGEIAGRCLAVDTAAFDAAGEEVVGELGELVIRAPMPSMPVCFWNDPGDERYHASYFEDFPGVWRHGDWILFTERGSCIITGRSDATRNRGGVRLGTGEVYSVVEGLDEVIESLVVHLEDREGGAGELLLFVVLSDGAVLDDDLRSRIAGVLRRELSPRHVPDTVEAVPSIPRTLTGKKLELPVKRMLLGTDPARVASRVALADPAALDAFADYARSRAAA